MLRFLLLKQNFLIIKWELWWVGTRVFCRFWNKLLLQFLESVLLPRWDILLRFLLHSWVVLWRHEWLLLSDSSDLRLFLSQEFLLHLVVLYEFISANIVIKLLVLNIFNHLVERFRQSLVYLVKLLHYFLVDVWLCTQGLIAELLQVLWQILQVPFVLLDLSEFDTFYRVWL